MRYLKTSLHGAVLIEPDLHADSRGFFARTFCVREFADQGLETRFVQHSCSFSAKRGTLRGMHFQLHPHGEVKVVRCVSGAIYDVIVDLRPNSPTYRKWEAFEISAANRCSLYVPEGFAHGFQTLSDDTEVHYLISAFYEPSASTGIRFDDPAISINWPLEVSVISERDLAWPPMDEEIEANV